MNKQRGYTLIELLTALIVLAVPILMVGGLYVIFHFVSKFW